MPQDEEKRSSESERKEQRELYAKALARDAFGRHYWDDKKAQELRRAARRRKRKSKV